MYDVPIPMPSPQSKILIATESPQIANILTAKLERDGFKVFWKPDGKRTLESVLKDPPDLLILDSILPDDSAFHLLEKFHALPGLEALPVFILLDVLQEHSAEEFLRGGARAVVQKPFRPTDLSKKIRKTLASLNLIPNNLVKLST